ncbi:hypothetical protein EDD33_1886 [Nocardioides aurantiacus]|uniref:Uncharacterized protein n=2 Tax=Nocardioides aurantiacus TaxID=86796 RepID=A0A3N2CU86_9ACTN|nr:hypothetical protein EDD33_1886 [Nocardioides aurantiacus]
MPTVPLGGRPAAPTFVGALLAVVLMSGCAGQGQACTQVGGIDLIALDVAPEVRADLTTLHVELCQAEVCGDITFPTATPSGPYLSIQPGRHPRRRHVHRRPEFSRGGLGRRRRNAPEGHR